MKTRNILFLLLSVFTVLACSEEKTSKEYIDSAELYKQKGDFDSAIFELKNLIRVDANNIEARYLLGAAYLQQGNTRSAQKELTRAFEGNWDYLLVVPKLAKAYYLNLESHSLTELLLQVEINDELSIIVNTYQGILALKAGKLKLAKEYIENANSLDADANFSKLGVAWLMVGGHKKQALALVEELTKSNDVFDEATLLKGHLLNASGQYDKAVEQYNAYLIKHPLFHQIRLFKANSLILGDELDQAEIVVDKMLQLYPNSPLVNQQKAKIRYINNDFYQAEQFADKVLLTDYNLPISTIISGVSAFKLKKFEKSYNTLLKVEADLPSSHPVKKLVSILQMELGYVELASESLGRLTDLGAVDANILQVASRQFAKLGDVDSVIHFLGEASELTPEDESLKVQLGILKIAQNNLSGIADLKQVINQSPNSTDANTALALTYIKNNKYSEALELAHQWQKQPEHDGRGLILEGLIYDKQNQVVKSKSIFQKAILEHDNTVAKYYLAIYAEREDDLALAESYFVKVLDKMVEHKGAIDGLVRIAIQSNFKFNQLELLKHLATSGNNFNAVTGAAKIIAISSHLNETLEFLGSIKKKYVNNLQFDLLLGDSYFKNNAINDAQIQYSTLLENHPNDIQVITRMIMLFERKKEYQQALDLIDKTTVSNINVNSLQLKMYQAHFQILTQQIEKARRTLRSLNQVEDPFIYFLKGNLALLEKNYHGAAEELERLYKLSPNNNIMLKIIEVLLLDGKPELAINRVELHLESFPDDFVMIIKLAGLYEKTDQNSKAAVHYRNILANSPNNYIILNNLAGVELKLGNNEQALKYSEKAYAFAKGNVQVIDTLALSYLKNGKADRAIELYSSILTKIKNNNEILLNYYEALEAMGKTSESKDVLEQINRNKETS